MTCIVGLEHEGEVYMGCDSAATDDSFRFSLAADSKVFSNENTIMGMCGSFRLGQLLKYSLKIPDRDPRIDDDMSWLVNDYVDALRDMLVDKGHISKGEHSIDQISDGDFLLGYRGKLYHVQSNFQVLRLDKGYASTGCGADFALGSLHYQSTHLKTINPIKMVKRALNAAAENSAACAPPHHVFKLNVDGVVEKVT
jgi:ATP-dependent protease HslVU (ClpYQ) peptidase subunit